MPKALVTNPQDMREGFKTVCEVNLEGEHSTDEMGNEVCRLSNGRTVIEAGKRI